MDSRSEQELQGRLELFPEDAGRGKTGDVFSRQQGGRLGSHGRGALPSGVFGSNGSATHAYGANVYSTWETITDPSGKARTLHSDALGRLIVVREDPATLKYATYYQYDLLDDLTQTRQAGTCNSVDPIATPCTGGMTRTFSYTGLGRLASAANPESGMVSYTDPPGP